MGSGGSLDLGKNAEQFYPNPIERSHAKRHPSDPACDHIVILTYEYDAQGNWIRCTLIRAVNPVDEDGQAFEDPVQVIKRDIACDLSAPSSTHRGPRLERDRWIDRVKKTVKVGGCVQRPI